MVSQKMREKFANIKPTIGELVYTEMGIFWHLITQEGVFCQEGGEYNDWPFIRFEALTDQDRKSIIQAIEEHSFTLETLKGTSLDILAMLIEDYNNNNEDKKYDITDKLPELKEVIERSDGYIFAYCQLESWEQDIVLFSSYSEMEEFIINAFEVTPWDELTDEDVEDYLDDLSEQGIVYQKDSRVEDEIKSI